MSDQPPGNGTLAYRVMKLEETIRDLRLENKELHAEIDRLIFAVVGSVLTLTASLVILAITNNV